jgi:hypothetical protein
MQIVGRGGDRTIALRGTNSVLAQLLPAQSMLVTVSMILSPKLAVKISGPPLVVLHSSLQPNSFQ